jgi:hypothetical protein
MLAADLIEPVAQLYLLKKANSPVCFARTFNPPG